MAGPPKALHPRGTLAGSTENLKAHGMLSELSGGMLELKFRLPCESIPAVLRWMRTELRADPHGSGEAGDGYLVRSLYLDTVAFDVYHRRSSYGRAKFRIRRYGEAEVVFLERKMKRSGRVRKRRVVIDPEDLGMLSLEANGTPWGGSWFHHRVSLRRLRPVVMMNYRRVARLGNDDGQTFRVTLDRELRAQPLSGYAVPRAIAGEDLLGGGAILEVKFAEALPSGAKALVESLRLEAAGFSKYRTGLVACGLVPAPVGAGPAGAA